MEYILELREIDKIIIEKEEYTDQDEIVEKNVSINFQNNEIIINIEPDEVYEDMMKEKMVFNLINNSFKQIILDKNNDTIKNIDEIFQNWENIKNNIIFEPSTSHSMIDSTFAMSAFFENKNFLAYSLKRYNIVPYLNIINLNELKSNDKIESDLQLYGILPYNILEYKVKFKYNEIYEDDNKIEIIFDGNGNTKAGGQSLVNSINDIIELPDDINFFVSTSIKGRYVFYRELESLKVEISFLVETMRDLVRSKYALKTIEIILNPKEGIKYD
jgi:hypothetical protein